MARTVEEFYVTKTRRGPLSKCILPCPNALCQQLSQVGPFLDSNNGKIKTGDVDQTPTELFHTQFIENIHDFLEASPNSLVLVVPSVRDVISHHCVYPQSALETPGLSGHPVG
jgi:hypothetical protein